ncbi:unnamed protein product [Brassica oleracea var. botrytis]
MCEVTVLVVNRCYKKTEASGLGAICVYSAEHREAYLNKVGSLKLKVEFEIAKISGFFALFNSKANLPV